MPENIPEPWAEARHTMHLCRICGYCNGLCEVFRAGQRRKAFADGDLEYLAHLCHNCRACWHDCQYARPHEFAVNVPATLARVRAESYRRNTWPGPLGKPGQRHRPTAAGIGLAGLLLGPLAALLLVPSQWLFATYRGPGAFYAIIPWQVMSGLAVTALVYAVMVTLMGVRRSFGRGTRPAQGRAPSRQAWARSIRDALTLRNLDGGGAGCQDPGGGLWQWRRLAHHGILYGLLLCLAATLAGAFYHHILGRIAPYPLLSLPSLLGTAGGIGILTGGAIMLAFQHHADPRPAATETIAAGTGLTYLLLAVAASGLLLQFLRETPAMGLLLTSHLGAVLGLFLTAPYGKMVHGAYRLAALARAAEERRGDGP